MNGEYIFRGDGGFKPILKDGKQKTDRSGRKAWAWRFGYKDANSGKFIFLPRRTYYGTEKEARRENERDKRACEELINNPQEHLTSITLSQYVDGLLPKLNKREDWKVNTLSDWERFAKYIKSELGEYKLNELTSENIENAWIAMKDNGKSQDIVNKCHKKLNRILKEAKREKLITENPAEDVSRKLVRMPVTKKQESLNLEEYKRVLERIETEPLDGRRMAAYLQLKFGLRPGEALALTWQDIDTKQATLTIDKTAINEGSHTNSPKTDASNRTLHLDAKTLMMLEEWQDSQQRQQLNRGYICSNTTNGQRLRYSKYNAWLKSFCEECEVKRLTPHNLRSTFATIMINELRKDPKTVSMLLGHKRVTITLDLYTQPSEKNLADALEDLAELTSN